MNELRVGWHGGNYRMLSFLHANVAAVVSHGLMKEKRVPPLENEQTRQSTEGFGRDPDRHTHQME